LTSATVFPGSKVMGPPWLLSVTPAMVIVALGFAVFGFRARSWRRSGWRSGNR
jgi:hypothetical protein